MKPIDTEGFKEALGQFASGVTVITVDSAEGLHGMTASAFCSVSLAPPLILVCVKTGNTMWTQLESVSGFAVNILAEDQEELSNRFAGGIVDAEGNWNPWPADRSKFEDLDYTIAEKTGAPLLSGTLSALNCMIEQRIDSGDHTIFVGRVVASRAVPRGAGRPLVYHAGGYKKVTQGGE